MSSAFRHVLSRTILPRSSNALLRPSTAGLLRTGLQRNFSEFTPLPIFTLTETEELLKDSVSRFANDAILPKVRDMDEAEQMDRGIVSQLFEQGLMGVEIPEEYGGSAMNFGACIVAIEELARVDPSVSCETQPPLKLRFCRLTTL